MLQKILLAGVENEDEPPLGLSVEGKFKRLGLTNPSVIQHYENGRPTNKLSLFPRLIYSEGDLEKSCILRQEAEIYRGSVRMLPGEKVVLGYSEPHASRGREDLRLCKLHREKPWHCFVVVHNGFDMRTEYIRTQDLEHFEKFEIYFPNIYVDEAIDIVTNEGYKQRWIKECGKDAIKEKKKNGFWVPERPFLPTKDCFLWPVKVLRKNSSGQEKKYYAVIIRLLPNIQVAYLESFKDLAEREFWQNLVKNIDDYLVIGRKYDWEESHIGAETSPLMLKEGALMFYHGVTQNHGIVYKGGAVLLDRNNPQRILGRTKNPILEPTEPWEMDSVTDKKVVFPSGHAVLNGKIHMFYGIGDRRIAYTTTSKQKLLDKLS